MSAQHIASTPKSRIQSLSYQGMRVAENFHQIKELVRARLGDDYALLFAEPGGLQSGEIIDWYSPIQGTPRRITELPEEEANRLAAYVGGMGKEIKNLAEDMKSGGGQSSVLRGMVLELALQYPDVSHIYAVGGHPVMTCWGFASSKKGAQPEDLARFGESFVPTAPAAGPAAQPEPQPATPQQPENRKSRSGLWSWLWLLPLLLLLSVLFVPFGNWHPLVSLLGASVFKVAPEGQHALQESRDEEKRLRADLAALRLKLGEQAALCVPESAQRATTKQDFGVPPQGSVALKEGLSSKPDVVIPEKILPRQDLVIPEHPGDYAFLQGRWKNAEGLVNKADKQPIETIYFFDANGNGTVTVLQKGRQDCTGKAKARRDDSGVLRIETERQICPGSQRQYSAEIIECRASVGAASCLGKTQGGESWGGNVYFHRVP
ncbi:MAG: hypothetical protein LBN28_03000 [Desulfovibrio sp.]|jgi:hypothetical protein|nr:hypothetical protein [Desulfovibrio sp.]